MAEAQSFVEAAEARLLELWIERDRAEWVQATYITDDTELLAAQANERLIAAAVELAKEATRFDGLQLPEDCGASSSCSSWPHPAGARRPRRRPPS